MHWTPSAHPVHLKVKPAALIEKLNHLCVGSSLAYERRFGGLSWTTNGNMTIHTCAPYTAQDAFTETKDIIENVVTACCDAPSKPLMKLNTPWHGIVIRDAPTDTIQTARDIPAYLRALTNALYSDTDIRSAHLQDVRFLCSDGDATAVDQSSIRLMFDSEDIASRLIRQGINFEGHHLRASVYRPKRRLPHPL